jgi:hypothetical protein
MHLAVGNKNSKFFSFKCKKRIITLNYFIISTANKIIKNTIDYCSNNTSSFSNTTDMKKR